MRLTIIFEVACNKNKNQEFILILETRQYKSDGNREIPIERTHFNRQSFFQHKYFSMVFMEEAIIYSKTLDEHGSKVVKRGPWWNLWQEKKPPRRHPNMFMVINPTRLPEVTKDDILTVAAHLRSLRSDDPLNKGHPRSI